MLMTKYSFKKKKKTPTAKYLITTPVTLVWFLNNQKKTIS